MGLTCSHLWYQTSITGLHSFWNSCDAIALVFMGHFSGLDAVLPVRRLRVCQAFLPGMCWVNGFHCLHPTFLAFLIQALYQYVSCGFKPLIGCCGCVVFIQLLAFFIPAWNVVFLIATWNLFPGYIGLHAAECLVRCVQVCVVQWW